MNRVSLQTHSPILNGKDRELASGLVDHWSVVLPSLRKDPNLYQECERLLNRYGEDMIHRVELIDRLETGIEKVTAVYEKKKRSLQTQHARETEKRR